MEGLAEGKEKSAEGDTEDAENSTIQVNTGHLKIVWELSKNNFDFFEDCQTRLSSEFGHLSTGDLVDPRIQENDENPTVKWIITCLSTYLH
jgi:hypothetical protein